MKKCLQYGIYLDIQKLGSISNRYEVEGRSFQKRKRKSIRTSLQTSSFDYLAFLKVYSIRLSQDCQLDTEQLNFVQGVQPLAHQMLSSLPECARDDHRSTLPIDHRPEAQLHEPSWFLPGWWIMLWFGVRKMPVDGLILVAYCRCTSHVRFNFMPAFASASGIGYRRCRSLAWVAEVYLLLAQDLSTSLKLVLLYVLPGLHYACWTHSKTSDTKHTFTS